TVDKWLKRYAEFGMEGLVSRVSPGGPRQIPDRIRARVLALTRASPPSALGVSHWSSTEMARYIKKTEGVYVSQTWVSRLWRENGLRPWQQGTFKISKDPDFEDKVRDVVGLYQNPPEGEVVVSVDAKSGIQALDRTQPMLPIDFGKTRKRTFDYARMGTTDLYAAMDIRTGAVISSLSATHATADFLRLMKKVVAAYPGQKVHGSCGPRQRFRAPVG
ncbi:MAG: IS630 family transposase, partial [Pseudonocardiaceae bacterium]